MASDADRTVALWRELAIVQRGVALDLDRSLREALGYPANWIDTLMALAGAPKGRQPMKPTYARHKCWPRLKLQPS